MHLAIDLGDFDRADALVASLPGGLVAVSAHLRTKLAFNIAHLALARGQLDEAERARSRPSFGRAGPSCNADATPPGAILALGAAPVAHAAHAAPGLYQTVNAWGRYFNDFGNAINESSDGILRPARRRRTGS